MKTLGRGTAAVALAAASVVALGTGPAAGSDPFANYRTAVTSVTPSIPGVTAKAESDGAEMIVSNSTAKPLVILGYQSEPYLRVTSAGVWENQESPATYLNKEYYIDSIPKSINADKPPRWKQISSSSKAIWHDHRIHWMGAIQPPAVAKDPHHAHLIKTWTVAMRYGKEPVTITGTLTWHPGSRWWSAYAPIAGIGGAIIVVLLLAVLRRRRSPQGDGPTSGRANTDG